MIQYNTFEMSKSKARLMYQDGVNRYLYWGDFSRQWETVYNSSKILGLVNSENSPSYNLLDTIAHLDMLSSEEQELKNEFEAFYYNTAKMISSTGKLSGIDNDAYETILDFREITKYKNYPLRVLDIGPGAGRHMVSLFQSKSMVPKLYVGLESIGMPYAIQNMAAKLLELQKKCNQVYDLVDYEFDRIPYPDIKELPKQSIVHLPLWMAEQLPDNFFDLIICSYVLDELPATDFTDIIGLIDRSLNEDGIVYCRGGQDRAHLGSLFQYGYGTYHGQDITTALLSNNLEVKHCEIQTSNITRVFARPDKIKSKTGAYAECKTDVELVTKIQADFIRSEVEQIVEKKKKVLLWTDQGSPNLQEYLGPYLVEMKIIGLTTRFTTVKNKLPWGFKEYPLDQALKKKPDVVIMISNKFESFLREIKEHSPAKGFELMRSFTYPIAFAYR